jgi:hypothetical protein
MDTGYDAGPWAMDGLAIASPESFKIQNLEFYTSHTKTESAFQHGEVILSYFRG